MVAIYLEAGAASCDIPPHYALSSPLDLSRQHEHLKKNYTFFGVVQLWFLHSCLPYI